MNIFQKYVRYIKNNPNNYWFRRKVFGWGWIPARWQGWLTILIYVASIVTLVLNREEAIPGNPDSGSNFLVFGGPIIVLTIILLIVCYKKGEKPRWSWGFPKD